VFVSSGSCVVPLVMISPERVVMALRCMFLLIGINTVT
jgi:hypothetical protein